MSLQMVDDFEDSAAPPRAPMGNTPIASEVAAKRQEILDSIAHLSVLQPTAARALSMLSNPNYDLGELVDTIEADPALTARLLRIANAPFFQAPRQIGTVREAAVRLGPKYLLNIITAGMVGNLQPDALAGYDLSPQSLSHHCLFVAVAAETLCETLEIETLPVLFTSAILHDVGKLVLSPFVSDHLSNIQQAVADGHSIDEAEETYLGIGHAEAGAALMNRWRLPKLIVDMVHWHHKPHAQKHWIAYIYLIYVADAISLMRGIGDAIDGELPVLSRRVTRHLGVTPDIMTSVGEQADERTTELLASLGA